MNRTQHLLIRSPEVAEHETVIDVWMKSWLSTGLGHADEGLFNELRIKFENKIANNWDLHIGVIGGQIIGMQALSLSEAKLDQLFVHPDFQRQGVGEKLVDFAKQKLPLGIWLKVDRLNEQAIRFYVAQGFVRGAMQPNQSQNEVHYVWAP